MILYLIHWRLFVFFQLTILLKLQESTAALCQMLKVGSSAASEQGTEQSSTNDALKGFGRQVSVQELFQGAQQQRQLQPKTPQKQHMPRQHQHHTPPQNKKSCLDNLLRYCQAMGMPAPRHDCHYGDNKRVGHFTWNWNVREKNSKV